VLGLLSQVLRHKDLKPQTQRVGIEDKRCAELLGQRSHELETELAIGFRIEIFR
jgi:hypothetical protein